jgi:hypothetical protein
MTDKLRLGTILSWMVIMTSCDCVVDHQGYVRDSRTEKPIANATIKFDKREYKTDSAGYFDIHYVTGFCPDWDFQIEKENYKTQKIKIELDNNEIIYRVQSDNDNRGWVEMNSLNFKVKNDTIHFYLMDTETN